MIAILSLITQWLSGLRDRHSTFVMVLISLGVALLVLLVEFAFKLFRMPAKIHKEQQNVILTFEESSAIKLQIECVRCNFPVNEDANCHVVIRNLSKTKKVENVMVRAIGKDVFKIFHDGYDPFHESDLVAVNGIKSINPDDTANFMFPKPLNQLVDMIAHKNFHPQVNMQQTFILVASSSDSPPTQAEFLICDDPGRMFSVKIEKCKPAS